MCRLRSHSVSAWRQYDNALFHIFFLPQTNTCGMFTFRVYVCFTVYVCLFYCLLSGKTSETCKTRHSLNFSILMNPSLNF